MYNVLQAVKQSFLLPYSKGVLGGEISRLYGIKRMMHRRSDGFIMKEGDFLKNSIMVVGRIPKSS